MCHNCGISTSFYNFLEKVDPNLVKEYSLERYKENDSGKTNHPQPDFHEAKAKPIFKERIGLPTVESLPENHHAKQYVISRKIPESFYSSLYFAEDFKKFVESLDVEKDGLIDNDQRLIIPFYDKEKRLVAIQGRALGASKIRYITVKIVEDVPKIFGLDRVNEEKKIYVVEGPIDSMFLDNAVATADSHLEAITQVFDKTKVVLVFDNEPRNKELCKQIEKAVDNHYSVVIWPEFIEEKDINDMILSGFSQEEIQEFIDKHTFVNLRAKAEFVNWKKI
jgi:predicted DNA binding CopG/RHH family protein